MKWLNSIRFVFFFCFFLNEWKIMVKICVFFCCLPGITRLEYGISKQCSYSGHEFKEKSWSESWLVPLLNFSWCFLILFSHNTNELFPLILVEFVSRDFELLVYLLIYFLKNGISRMSCELKEFLWAGWSSFCCCQFGHKLCGSS